MHFSWSTSSKCKGTKWFQWKVVQLAAFFRNFSAYWINFSGKGKAFHGLFSLYNWDYCVEFYLVTPAIVKCWDQPRIPDLFQGLGEGLVQGPVHQNLIRDRESIFITYVHRCFLCFVLENLWFFWCRLQPWQWAYLSCMVNLKWFSRFSSPISFFPSWNSPSSGFPSSFCPVFTSHFFSKMVHAEVFWVANSGALR